MPAYHLQVLGALAYLCYSFYPLITSLDQLDTEQQRLDKPWAVAHANSTAAVLERGEVDTISKFYFHFYHSLLMMRLSATVLQVNRLL
jgi:hypothetical protein